MTPTTRTRHTLFAGLLLLACHVTVLAQSAPAPAPPPATPASPPEPDKKSPDRKAEKPAPKPETIEVKSTGEYNERQDDTATKIVVNNAEINKYGDTQVLDVLKRLPGITVQGNQVRMRGLSQGYTQILVDGERPPPGFSLEQLSPTLIERIEIIRAATAEFSTQSIAGTLNIVLKQKISFAQRDLRFNYAQGSYYKSPGTNFVLSDKAGALGYTISGSLYSYTSRFENAIEEDAFDAAGRPTLHRLSNTLSNGKGHGYNVAPRLVWTLGGGDSLSLHGFFNSNRGSNSGSYGYTLAEGTPVPVYRNESRSLNRNEFFRTEANWIKKLADGAKLDLKLSAGHGEFDNERFLKGFNLADQQNLDRTNITSSSEKTLTSVGKFSKPLLEGHSFVAGWDVSRAERDQSNLQNDVAIAGVLPAVPSFNADERFEATVDKAAWFAQDEWNITKAWSLYLGLRWEGIRTKSDGTGLEQSSNTSSVWSPLMQTLYKLQSRPGEQVRFALTRTYKAPNTNSLIRRRFSSVDNSPTSPDFTGNPDLKPELATGVDLAYEIFWGQSSSMSFAASMRRLTDYNRTGLLFIDGRWTQLPINDGKAQTKSLEFDTKFPVQSVWKSAPPLDFRFNMNRNWSSVESVPGPNNRLDQQTPFSATLGLDYRMQGGMIVAGGNFSMKQGGAVRISENQTIFQTPKRELDVYGLYKITPKAQVRLTLSNILKPESRDERAYFDLNGTTRTLTLSPSKVTVRLGVEIKL